VCGGEIDVRDENIIWKLGPREVYGPTLGSPFLSLDDAPDAYEWLKMALLSPLLIVRVFSLVAHLTAFWMLASLKLWRGGCTR
jgi:hypothetical protein